MKPGRLLLFLGATLTFVHMAGAAEKPWYGFHIQPTTSGFPLNPVVRSVMIDKIKKGSAAEEKGMRVGDEIIEADGKVVPGSRALQLVTAFNKKPGDWLRLRLQRPNGEKYSVVIQAIKKPGT